MNSLAKKALIFALALVAVAAAGRFGRKAYRTATERRLIAQAHRYFLDKDLHNATICLRRALQVDPWSVEAAWTTADMLEAAGMPAALNWRIRAAQLKPTEMEYRFAWARTALKIQNLRSAAEALSGVDDPGKATATYHKLGGALAWELHNAAEAEKQYTEALQLEPTNASIPLNLATIHLASTNIDVANAARLSMERMAAATNSELRTTALHYLAADANSHKLFGKAIGYSGRPRARSPRLGWPRCRTRPNPRLRWPFSLENGWLRRAILPPPWPGCRALLPASRPTNPCR
jgi:cytochrome c-type biogenesis protein CcmH/NrfG